MAAVWRAAGRGRGSGSGRNRPEPEASLTEGDGDPVEGTPGADGGALHEALAVDVDGAEEGREDRWWENEWRVTPGGWSNGSSWHEWHGSDN